MIEDAEREYIMKTYQAIMDFSDLMQCLAASSRTVYRIIEEKIIPAWKADGEWCFSRADVLAYLDRNGDF